MIKEITKTDVRNMQMETALQLLLSAAQSHCKGSGCGPGHQVPVGEEKRRLEIAMAKVYFRLYKHFPGWVEQ